MEKLRLAILKNERQEDDHRWKEACAERQDEVVLDEVDLTRADWLEQIREGSYDGLLARPPAYTAPFRNLYEERVRILHEVDGYPIWPAPKEIALYENKKFLAYWLKAHGVPHPPTYVFYYQEEALDFIRTATLPLVGKTNIGASGTGVRILRSAEQAAEYVQQVFSGKGAPRRGVPAWKKKGFLGRALRRLANPRKLTAQLQLYSAVRSKSQRDFVIFQDFVPHQFEWRCVRIGDSFFAHKKMLEGDMASGSLIKGYDNPPLELLDFVRELTDKHGFRSQAVDLFVSVEGKYLVNEMQCLFGQSDPYQMLVDGQPGRYLFQDGSWQFEAGDFNRYESYLLRLDDFLARLKMGQAIT